MEYKFKLPIGDWSGDGHSQCEYFVIDSNVSAEALVPIYIEMDAKYNISGVCSQYEDTKMDADYIDFLESINIDPKDYFEDYDVDEYDQYIYADGLAQLVIDLLMNFDESLKLKIVKDEMPMFNNWLGQKVKGISGGGVFRLPGYGVFSM